MRGWLVAGQGKRLSSVDSRLRCWTSDDDGEVNGTKTRDPPLPGRPRLANAVLSALSTCR